MNEKNKDEKDDLYYEDLIYEIIRLANIKHTKDEVREERIKHRKSLTKVEIDGKVCPALSEFSMEIMNFVLKVSSKAHVVFDSEEEISKCPYLVLTTIDELYFDTAKGKSITRILK